MITMSAGPASEAQMSLDSPHYGSLQNSRAALAPEARQQRATSPRSTHVAVAVLCYVNLVNYIERYTIAGTCWAVFRCVCVGVCATCSIMLVVYSLTCSSPTGVLPNIQAYFDLSDGTAALLQTGTTLAVKSAEMWQQMPPRRGRKVINDACVQSSFAASYSWLLSLVTLATATTGSIS